jgi:hypothetical protein
MNISFLNFETVNGVEGTVEVIGVTPQNFFKVQVFEPSPGQRWVLRRCYGWSPDETQRYFFAERLLS